MVTIGFVWVSAFVFCQNDDHPLDFGVYYPIFRRTPQKHSPNRPPKSGGEAICASDPNHSNFD